MANYIAATPGIQPTPRPIVDVGGIVNSLSQAYQSNKQGVLQRAMLQHQVAQQNAELQMRQQEQELQLRQAGWRPQEEVQPPVAAPASPAPQAPPGPVSAAIAQPAPPPPVADVMAGAPTPAPRIAPVPAAAPSAVASPAPSAGPPSQSMQFNGKTYVLGTPPALQRQMDARRQALTAANTAHPGMFTSEQIEAAVHDDHAYDQAFRRVDVRQQAEADHDARLQSLRAANALSKRPLSDEVLQGLAADPVTSRTYFDSLVNPKETPEARATLEETVHQANRTFDANHPVRGEGEDPKAKRADAYIAHRITALTASQPNPHGGARISGLGFDSAQSQAITEAGKLYGHDAISSYVQPAASPPHPNTDKPGNVTLSAPQGTDRVKEAQPEFDATGAKYQQALKLGVPPEQARAAYNADLVAIARKHGLAQ